MTSSNTKPSTLKLTINTSSPLHPSPIPSRPPRSLQPIFPLPGTTRLSHPSQSPSTPSSPPSPPYHTAPSSPLPPWPFLEVHPARLRRLVALCPLNEIRIAIADLEMTLAFIEDVALDVLDQDRHPRSERERRRKEMNMWLVDGMECVQEELEEALGRLVRIVKENASERADLKGVDMSTAAGEVEWECSGEAWKERLTLFLKYVINKEACDDGEGEWRWRTGLQQVLSFVGIIAGSRK